MKRNTVRIGGGSGFWGDTADGPLQLVTHGAIDYLALDYMAEVTMSLLARVRTKKPEMGYAPEFVADVVEALAQQLADKRIKVVCNAGGVNPMACAAAVRAELQRQGIALNVVAITGDNAMPLIKEIRARGIREMATGQPIPEVITANAYMGAFPIARALAEGADIVITGRCADSALALGPLIHEFGWTPEDFDLLAAGSLAGHIIECGPQSTGGFFTDWRDVSDSWFNIGFPIVDCHRDGTIIVTKPVGTGGMVSLGTVAEQVTYETGDPKNYILPDVVCDLSQVSLELIGSDSIKITGVTGKPPTPYLKVSGTWHDGYRSLATLLIRGIDAVDKARAVAKSIVDRTESTFARKGLLHYSEVSVEVIGADEAYADSPFNLQRREVMLKLAVRHADKKALDIFSREIFPTSTGTVQGVGGVFGGRPKVQPMVRLFSFLVPRELFPAQVHFESRTVEVPSSVSFEAAEVLQTHRGAAPSSIRPPSIDIGEASVTVPLVALAFGRSGDKGDISNIAIISRRPEFHETIEKQITEQSVAWWMHKLVKGRVERFDWPGLLGFNFLLHEALGGGGVASLRYDPQGKAHGQILLEHPVTIPTRWIDEGLVANGHGMTA